MHGVHLMRSTGNVVGSYDEVSNHSVRAKRDQGGLTIVEHQQAGPIQSVLNVQVREQLPLPMQDP